MLAVLFLYRRHTNIYYIAVPNANIRNNFIIDTAEIFSVCRCVYGMMIGMICSSCSSLVSSSIIITIIPPVDC